MSTSMNHLRPLITICGTTGVGKSNLAIELALHLGRGARTDGWRGARIINADSMQVYGGMDIITNKVPEAERQGIEHLLMGFKAPGEQYVVGQWVQDALKAIDETHKRNEVPIVVGGTSYWIQHLLFPNRLAPDNQATSQGPCPEANGGGLLELKLADVVSSLPLNLLTLFNDLPLHPPSASNDPDAALNLHTLLSALDPLVANRWHWKDTRKVLRSLGVIRASGKRTSEIIREQSEDTSASQPRFRTLCYWLYAEPTVLGPRLNERIDSMIERGLLSEIHGLHHTAIAAGEAANAKSHMVVDVKTDYTTGIYQSIGYKEFYGYLSAPDPSEKLFNAAVDRMKLSTRQYAKRQVSWIRNKMLPAVHAANFESVVMHMYMLDATDLGELWDNNVRNLAIQLTEDFLSERDLPDPMTLSDRAQKMMKVDSKDTEDPYLTLTARQKRICHLCSTHPNRPFMVEQGREWEAHCKTRGHRRLALKERQGRPTGDEKGVNVAHKASDDSSDIEYSGSFT